MKIAYVTDSGTGKSIAEMAKDGIISVPLQISDEKNTYQDLENLSKSDLIHLLEEEHVFKTSQPSPGIIQECFESLKKQGLATEDLGIKEVQLQVSEKDAKIAELEKQIEDIKTQSKVEQEEISKTISEKDAKIAELEKLVADKNTKK